MGNCLEHLIDKHWKDCLSMIRVIWIISSGRFWIYFLQHFFPCRNLLYLGVEKLERIDVHKMLAILNLAICVASGCIGKITLLIISINDKDCTEVFQISLFFAINRYMMCTQCIEMGTDLVILIWQKHFNSNYSNTFVIVPLMFSPSQDRWVNVLCVSSSILLFVHKNNKRFDIHVYFDVLIEEEVGGILGMKKFVHHEEFKKLNVGFTLDEGEGRH